MKRFAALFTALDGTTSSTAKLAALTAYFRAADPADAAWAVYFLAGGKPRQLVPAKLLRQVAQEAAGLPEWLFDECYEAVGDLAETISLVLPAPTTGPAEGDGPGLAALMQEQLLPLRGLSPDSVGPRLRALWAGLGSTEILVATKLITGNLRIGVSRLLVTRALATVAGLDPKLIAQRLVSSTGTGRLPTAADHAALLAPAEAQPEGAPVRGGAPYPFFLAHALPRGAEQEPPDLPALLGSPGAWLAEWKWDGIRAQALQRGGQWWLWSRGEELISEQFPELAALAPCLPDGTALDGEVLAWQDGLPQAFAVLQQRLGRKRLTPAVLQQWPVVFMAYDLLEWQGQDLRARPQHERRSLLEQAVAQALALAEAAGQRLPLTLSPLVPGSDWAALAAAREEARSRGVEGLMLKGRDAAYGVGRTKDVGQWWKWKLDPFSIDAVLIYAQAGHGRRANLYTDYTFAVWDGEPGQPGRRLVPFAKAYSGLTDEEIAKVDHFVRRHTLEKFGPVRSVEPRLVFELGFEGISRSTRHKSGVALRFPRMLRWRQDKPVEEADTLAQLVALLPAP